MVELNSSIETPPARPAMNPAAPAAATLVTFSLVAAWTATPWKLARVSKPPVVV